MSNHGEPTLMRLIWEWKLVAGNSWNRDLDLNMTHWISLAMSKGHLVDQNVHKIPGFGAKNLMMAPVFPILSFQGTLVLGDKNPKHKS